MSDERLMVFQSGDWSAYVMPDQLYLGRLVIPLSRECRSLSEVTTIEMATFHHAVTTLEAALRHAFSATMFNWCCLMNNAYQLPDPKPQVHWHVRPRYDHPVEFDGQTYMDPNFGHHYLRQDADKRLVPFEVQEAVARKLRQAVGTVLAMRVMD